MKTRNSAFYREICILRILVKMGYIDKKALPHIRKGCVLFNFVLTSRWYTFRKFRFRNKNI